MPTSAIEKIEAYIQTQEEDWQLGQPNDYLSQRPLFANSQSAMDSIDKWLYITSDIKVLREFSFEIISTADAWDRLLAGLFNGDYAPIGAILNAIDVGKPEKEISQELLDDLDQLDEMVINDEIKLYSHGCEFIEMLRLFINTKTASAFSTQRLVTMFSIFMCEIIHDYVGP